MRSILLTSALSFEERRLDIVDLVFAGLLSGIWPRLERRSAAGVAAERALDERGVGPSPEAVRDAAKGYRYARGLLAREDLERWLGERRLTVDDWHGHLRRALAREIGAAQGEADAAPVLRADAICSGTLLDCANEVIAGAAASRELGDGDRDVDDEQVVRLIDLARAATPASGLGELSDAEVERRARITAVFARGRELLEREVAGADAVARCLASNSLEWLTFQTEEVEVASEDAAREARLCVQEDGAALTEIAPLVGSVVARRSRMFGESPEGLRTCLVTAAPGDVIGPIPVGGTHLVARLVAKTAPSMRDPTAVARARSELVAAAISARTAGRVTWHVAL